MEPAALIFDCDGTLADTMPLHYVAWRATMAVYDIPFPEDRFYALGGRPSVSIAQLLGDEFGVRLDAEQVAAEKERRFLSQLPSVRPIGPILNIAQNHAGKVPMGVGSGAIHAVVRATLRAIDALHLFAAIVGADDTERHKPDPDVFLAVADRLKVPPHRCLVYEDADLGIEAAQRAGMAWFDVRTVFTPKRLT